MQLIGGGPSEADPNADTRGARKGREEGRKPHAGPLHLESFGVHATLAETLGAFLSRPGEASSEWKAQMASVDSTLRDGRGR